jgi:hypothetical protein
MIPPKRQATIVSAPKAKSKSDCHSRKKKSPTRSSRVSEKILPKMLPNTAVRFAMQRATRSALPLVPQHVGDRTV